MNQQFSVSFDESTIPLSKLATNVAINCARGLRPAPVAEPGSRGAIAIAGSGPSLRDTFPYEPPVAVLNGAWRVLADRGVIPKYVVVHDPSPQNVEWFLGAPKGPTYLVASRVDPAVLDALLALDGRDVRLWHTFGTAEVEALRGVVPDPVSATVTGGCTVGLVAMNLLWTMGYDHFDLYGYDSSFDELGDHHALPQEWYRTEPRLFQVGGRSFLAEPWMAAQVEQFFHQVDANRTRYTVDVRGGGMLRAAVEEKWGRTHDREDLTVLYNLDYAPGSFDFLSSLMNVEVLRRDGGYRRARVVLKTVRHPDGVPRGAPIVMDDEQKSLMMNCVVRPMLSMVGAEEVEGVEGREFFFREGETTLPIYSPRVLIDSWHRTGELPALRASDEATRWARPYAGATTITLREASYWPQRNSRLDEWLEFADWLRARDERVVVVRDTAKSGESFGTHDTCPWASVDLHYRLALYRAARMNYFVVNGPAGLAWLTRDVPYTILWTRAPGYPSYDPAWLKEFIGIDHPGWQWPWRDPGRQGMVWCEDTFENLRSIHLSREGTEE